ncbi:Tetratricopeptide TPR_2 repeat-containing protein [Thalassoporum mexicanum PCC 7367]|uniref:tetratricopeptide repeat protein n=1 Tax=Thalassoporum mexicanum TaxID=3457544 RepID=UPI00029FA0B7|nr:tetratricopeptide repeat protein [Pseudanabaena sp. PCC 7367]AFY70382.1 Tetratricopeptide TPR_2 repeat-containing protein [Pseudanabaena sp. PCC 7367]
MNREQRRKAAKNGNQTQRDRSLLNAMSGASQSQDNIASDLLSQGLALHKSGNLAAAKEIYASLLAKTPDHPRLLNYFGVLKGQMGDPKGAIELLKQAIHLDPNNFGYLNNLGNFYRAVGALDQAIDCYDRAAAINPQSADSLLNLGIAYTEQGKSDQAIVTLEKALILNPLHPRAQTMLGDLLQAKGNLDRAIASYTKALALQPNSFNALASLGMAFFRKGDLENAQHAYENALAIEPLSIDALTNIGATFYERGNIKMALACYREVINIVPRSPTAHINLAFLLAQQNQDQGAIDSYQTVLTHAPNSLSAMAGLAEIYAKQSQWPEAIALYEKMLVQDNSLADTHASLGIALNANGEIDRAIAQFEQARQLNPQHIKAHAHLGLALQTSKSQQANEIFDFERLVVSYPLDQAIGSDIHRSEQVNRDATETSWRSIADFNAALAKYVYQHPTLLRDRPGKPINYGQQTYEIFQDHNPLITNLAQAIDQKLRDYFQQAQAIASHSNNSFFANPPWQWQLSGWAVVLESEGWQTAHIHPESYCSGVYYIQLPTEVGNKSSYAGNLSFGDLFPGLDQQSKLAQYTITPAAGLLVLFPSYFWHATIPFQAQAEQREQRDRICISFNVIPQAG